MKKVAAMLGAALLGVSLVACGKTVVEEEPTDYEMINQTGKLTDYSGSVTIGQYTGLSASVDSVTVSDEQVDGSIEETVYLYNIMNTTNSGDEIEWGDEAASILSGGKYTNADAYKAYVKEELIKQKEAVQQKEFLNRIWDQIIEGSTFTINESDIDAQAETYYNSQKDLYTTNASYYGLDYETYMEQKQGMTDEEFRGKCREYVIRERQRIMASSVIFYKQNMEISDKDFSKAVDGFVKQYSGYSSSAQFVEKFGEDYIREIIASQMVDKYLLSVNTMNVD